MICSLNHIVINMAANGAGFITTVDRDGNELNILKEKKTDEIYRNYHCTSCGAVFKGEDPVDWQAVIDHLGNKHTPWYDVDDKDIIDMEWTDLNDPNIRPSVKKLIIDLQEIFGDGDTRSTDASV